MAKSRHCSVSILPADDRKPECLQCFQGYRKGIFTSNELIRMMVYSLHPASIYLLKVNKRNTRRRCENNQSLRQKHQNDVSDVVLIFLLLTLNIFHIFF